MSDVANVSPTHTHTHMYLYVHITKVKQDIGVAVVLLLARVCMYCRCICVMSYSLLYSIQQVPSYTWIVYSYFDKNRKLHCIYWNWLPLTPAIAFNRCTDMHEYILMCPVNSHSVQAPDQSFVMFCSTCIRNSFLLK